MSTFFSLGLRASSSSAAACFPELFQDFYKVIEGDSISKVRDFNNKLQQFLSRLPKGAYWSNGESSAEIKYQLSLRGLCEEFVAPPFRMQNKVEREIATKVYESYTAYLEERDINVLSK